nr:integrase, catalytic region, zinc finger, CCHC-type, peptidase aspartic, catalytic [Tanacetum cinerariifolium]
MTITLNKITANTNNSQLKLKKTQVEDHPRIPSISNNIKSITACNDNLNSRTLNVNAVCATCGKCLVDSDHFACVTKMLNDVNARTKKLNVVPISTRKPKGYANKTVATPHKKKVASKSTTQKQKSYYRMLYEKTMSKAKGSSFKSKAVLSLKGRLNLLHMDLCGPMRVASINRKKYILIVQLILFIVDSGCTKHMTDNLKLLCNFVEKFLGTVHFADTHVPLQQELDLLFGPLYDEFFNEGSNPKDTQPTTNIRPTSAPSTPTYVHVDENNNNQAEEEHIQDDEFTNPFCTRVSEYRWTKYHPLEQVRRNPSKPVQTRRQLATDPKMCMFALTTNFKREEQLPRSSIDRESIEDIV